MTDPAGELLEALRDVEDPANGRDIVAMDLVNDITVEGETAGVSLAFNTPFSPTELAIGNEIREVIQGEGYDPELSAAVGAEHGFDEEVLPNVRNVVAVASGKGGVGKTTVAGNLAAGLRERGARVGLLDADVHGPNVPRVLAVDEEPGVEPTSDQLVPPESYGVKVMSMGFMLHDPDDPAIMRGPMVEKVMNHFLENVAWGELDYLVVDLPPGTGDASLNLLQTLPVAGVVIVTTPQALSLDDAKKGLRLFEKHGTPVLGIVENMSGFRCPSCGDDHALFEGDGAQSICAEYDVPHLGTLPMHPDFGTDTDPVATNPESDVHDAVRDIVGDTADGIGAINRRRVAEPDQVSAGGG